MREIEQKLAVDPSFVVPTITFLDGSEIRMRELPTQNLRAVYFDTQDLRLARQGITLRHRSGEDQTMWTLKLPVDSSTITMRDEINFDGESPEVPVEAARLVTAYARGSELIPVARLRTRRRRWMIANEGGTDLAELVDDEVSVIDGGEIVSRFREIEIEAREGGESHLKQLSLVLKEAGAVVAEPIPKAVRALGPRATAPPDLPTPPEAGPDDPASLVVRAAIARGVGRIVTNDPGVRQNDVEAVHQMRVGARRLRSDLRTFQPLVHSYWAGPLSEGLRWLVDLLGTVRDIDVFKENMDEIAADLHEDLKPLYETLDAEHEEARVVLMEALAGDTYVKLVDKLYDVAREPHLTEEAARPSSEVLPPLVAAAWKDLAKKAKDLEADSDPADFHKARIRAKRARYAAEAVAPALGARSTKAKEFASRAEALQQLLGEHQDAHVASAEVERLAALHPDDANLQLAAGRLIERQLAKARVRRESFPRVWKKLSAKKRRKWFET